MSCPELDDRAGVKLVERDDCIVQFELGLSLVTFALPCRLPLLFSLIDADGFCLMTKPY